MMIYINGGPYGVQLSKDLRGTLKNNVLNDFIKAEKDDKEF